MIADKKEEVKLRLEQERVECEKMQNKLRVQEE